jgi:ribose transport system permease protein
MASLTEEHPALVTEPHTGAGSMLRGRHFGYVRHPAVWIGLVDIFLIVLFGLISPGHVFFKAGNFTDMARDSSQLVLLAAGFCLLLGAGEFDISVGANVILSSVLGGKVILALAGSSQQEAAGQYPHITSALLLGFLTCASVGAMFGLVNGLIVTRLKVNSFVTTLGTLGIGTGLALVISGGNDLTGLPPSLQTDFGVYDIFGVIPAAAVITFVVLIVVYVVLRMTRFGIRVVALGSSRQAAIRAGLRARREVTALFVILGFLAGIAGIMDLTRFDTTNISGHQTDALQAIAGVIIGGASLYGGKVSVVGAVFGTILSVILATGLVIQGFSPFWEQVVVGAILIAAVAIRTNLLNKGERSGS